MYQSKNNIRKKNEVICIAVSSFLIGTIFVLCLQIKVTMYNDTKVLVQETLNASTTSVILHNLTFGASYITRIVAYTGAGEGPYSNGIVLSINPDYAVKTYMNQKNREYALIILAFFVVCAILCGVSIPIYVRRRNSSDKKLDNLDGEFLLVCRPGKTVR